MINIQKIQRGIRMAQRLGDSDTYAQGEVLRSAEAALDGTDDGAVKYLRILAGADATAFHPALHVVLESARVLLARATKEEA